MSFPALLFSEEQARHMDELAARIAKRRYECRGRPRASPPVLDVGWEYRREGDAEKVPFRDPTPLEESEHARRALEARRSIGACPQEEGILVDFTEDWGPEVLT